MVKVPIWEPNVSDLPGASRTPHATPEAFGAQIGVAQQQAGRDIAAGLTSLGGALTAQADEQEAIKSKVTLSDHETAVTAEKLRLQTTTPASDAAKIPDMIQQFATDDWNQRRANISGKYQSIADANAHIFHNKSYVQNQAGAVKQYYDSIETQIKGEVQRQSMLVFADPNNLPAAAGAVRAYVDEATFPPELKRQLLVDAATALQTQTLAGYKLRVENAAASGNIAEATRLQAEAAKAAVNLPAQLTERLGINAPPKAIPPQIMQPGQPLPMPQGQRPLPGQRPQLPGQPRTEVETTDPVKVASTMLGYDERTHRSVIAQFISNVGGGKVDPATTPWCAAFVNAVLRTTGEPGTGSLAARSFLRYGTPVSEPQKGDIVVFARGAGKGHVGFFVGTDNRGNIQVLGGNQGDKVSIATYGRASVLGYRRIGHRQMAASPDDYSSFV